MFPEVSTQCEWGQGRNRRHLGDSIAAGLASGWPWGHSRPPHTRRRQHREPRRGRGRGHPQRRTISSEVILRATVETGEAEVPTPRTPAVIDWSPQEDVVAVA